MFATTVGERWDYDHPTRRQLDTIFDGNDMMPVPFTGFLNNYVAYLQYMRYVPSAFMNKLNQNIRLFNEYIEDLLRRKHGGECVMDDMIAAYIDECDKKADNVHFDGKYDHDLVGRWT